VAGQKVNVKRALFRWRSVRSNTKEEKNGCAATGRAHSDHSFQDIKRHEHKYLERRIYPAKSIEGRTTVPPDERQNRTSYRQLIPRRT